MKRPLFALWLTLPVAAYAYHMGPGQEHMRLDQVAVLIESADFHVAEAERIAALNGDEAAVEDWTRAEADYAEALDLLPDERVTEARRLKLERAKAQMFISKLPVANATLSGMVTELLDVPDVDPELLADVQRTFATSQYYMTWLQRLEGAPREEWSPASTQLDRSSSSWRPRLRQRTTKKQPKKLARTLSPPSVWRAWTSPSCKDSRCQANDRVAVVVAVAAKQTKVRSPKMRAARAQARP
jgi:hypothetical protein